MNKRTKATDIPPKIREEVEEIWKDISGYKGLYQISNKGNIRRLHNYYYLAPNGNYRAYVYSEGKRINIGTYLNQEEAKQAVIDYSQSHKVTLWKLIKPRVIKGHLQISLYKNGKVKHFYVHRLVAESFLSNPKHYDVVNHLDFNGLNNRVENLEWCDQKHNVNYSSINMRKPKTKDTRCSPYPKYIRKRTNKYELSIRLTNLYYYERFSSIDDAIECRNKILKEHGYEIKEDKGY